MKMRQRKRRHFLHVRIDVCGVMVQAWVYNRQRVVVKHLMRYRSFVEMEYERAAQPRSFSNPAPSTH